MYSYFDSFIVEGRSFEKLTFHSKFRNNFRVLYRRLYGGRFILER